MTSEPIWQPDPAQVAGSAIARFAGHLQRRYGVEFPGYLSLWQWSVDHLEEFWSAVWDFFGIEADAGAAQPALADAVMPGAQWFPGTRLN
jgi:acetoacetyl-CoA synthetase